MICHCAGSDPLLQSMQCDLSPQSVITVVRAFQNSSYCWGLQKSSCIHVHRTRPLALGQWLISDPSPEEPQWP